MSYDQRLIAAKLRRWEKYLKNYSIPEWDSLPDLDLYMDQVIALLSQYLDFLPYDENFDKLITPSIINNYVRMKIIPPPQKKKYSRVHLAYLIMICSLKQSLNISYVQKILPLDQPEEVVKDTYNKFVHTHKTFSEYFISQIRTIARPVLDHKDPDGSNTDDVIMTSAIAANMSKLLTEKMVKLQNVSLEEMKDAIE